MNDAEWFAEHTAYLATPEWAFRRGQVLNRDGYRCLARLPGCAGDANQVHHTSYKHWRNEPLFDLVSVCSQCHTSITEMDRASRPPESRIKSGDLLWGGPLIAQICAYLTEPRTVEEIAEYIGVMPTTVRMAIRRNRSVTEVDGLYVLADNIGIDLLD